LAVLLIATAVKDAAAVKHCWCLQNIREQVRNQLHNSNRQNMRYWQADNDAGNIMAALKRNVSSGKGQNLQ